MAGLGGNYRGSLKGPHQEGLKPQASALAWLEVWIPGRDCLIDLPSSLLCPAISVEKSRLPVIRSFTIVHFANTVLATWVVSTFLPFWTML